MTEDRLRVLVVDDERPIRRFLDAALTAHGYVVFEAATGEEALAAVIAQRPDLIILDLGLPGMDGVEVTRRLREWSRLPIVILSVREQEKDKIEALDAGADDYLTKPFGIGELLARMRVVQRRAAQPQSMPTFQVGDLVVDLARRQVALAGNEVALTPTEYDLLRVLVQNAGKVLTHNYLLRQVWGSGYEGEMHLLQVNVSNLRHKIEPVPGQPRYIVTEPGVGYRLRVES
jgi:two-component system KDP operon response regulator KdpE